MEHVIRSFARLVDFFVAKDSVFVDRFYPDRRTHLFVRGGHSSKRIVHSSKRIPLCWGAVGVRLRGHDPKTKGEIFLQFLNEKKSF